jgi:hypothetical protein
MPVSLPEYAVTEGNWKIETPKASSTSCFSIWETSLSWSAGSIAVCRSVSQPSTFLLE